MIKVDGEMLVKMINRMANKILIKKQEVTGDKITRVMALY